MATPRNSSGVVFFTGPDFVAGFDGTIWVDCADAVALKAVQRNSASTDDVAFFIIFTLSDSNELLEELKNHHTLEPTVIVDPAVLVVDPYGSSVGG